jgi:PAS domain S-box-containing protein
MTSSDLSERRHIDDRLRLQAQLLDSVHEAVVATDVHSNVIFWGPGAQALFGYTGNEVMGRPLGLLVLPDAREAPAVLEAVRREVFAGRTIQWHGFRRRKDGSLFYADISMAPVRDGGGSPTGLIGIYRDITELRRKEEMLHKSRERMRSLAARSMVVREEERTAIARELHDELGQVLTRLTIDLHWFFERVPKRLLTKRAMSIFSLVEGTLERLRTICTQLRPAILDDLGLEAAIEWQVQEVAELQNCRYTMDLQLGSLRPQTQRDTAAFRIVQEALTNVSRHAAAREVLVRGRVRHGALIIHVRDDGSGFDLSKLKSESLGLLGMQERAEGARGRVAVRSRPGQGTVVTVSLPVDA